jgi:hypothetical protein
MRSTKWWFWVARDLQVDAVQADGVAPFLTALEEALSALRRCRVLGERRAAARAALSRFDADAQLQHGDKILQGAQLFGIRNGVFAQPDDEGADAVAGLDQTGGLAGMASRDGG